MKFFSAISILLILFAQQLNGQQFIEFQDSAKIDHVFDQTAFLGGGAAFFDYDNDDDDDLYITAGNDRDHFYENNGDGTFTYKSIEAGFVITKLYYTTGVIAGDIDNDGFKDLFVTTWFSDFEPLGKNLLFKNNGDGTFSEIWNQGDNDKAQTMGAVFLDYDLDGLLDIYAVNYVDEAIFIFDNNGNIIGFDHDCYANNLYHNLGNGEFDENGFALNVHDNGCALAVTSTDFDLDGDMDIYIANDFGAFVKPNQLYQFNSDNGFFWGVAPAYNADIPMYGMGIAVGDIDQDLDLDYYVTNFGKNILLQNNGSSFTDITDISGTGDQWVVEDSTMAVGWGTSFLDIDNDSDLDLYVSNGFVPSPAFLPSQLYMNDKLFQNKGNLIFEDISENYGIDNTYTSRGMSYSDYDNDGDLDIISVVQTVPANIPGWQTVLYNNQAGNQKNWIQVSLEGITVNRDAYGSKVYLYFGDKTLLQEVSGGSSHCSHVSSRLHFGLDEENFIDSINVVWTGGTKSQTIYDLTVNQHIHIVEDTASIDTTTYTEIHDSPSFNIRIYPNPANDKLTIHILNDDSFLNGKIGFYNSLGKELKQVKRKSANGLYEIYLENILNGIYFIKIERGNKYVYKKIIIQK